MHFTDGCEPHVERALYLKLRNLPGLKCMGLEVRMGEKCGVVIARGRHIHAIWHAGNGDFDLIPTGYNAPAAIVKSMDEVITLTLDYLAGKQTEWPAPQGVCCCS